MLFLCPECPSSFPLDVLDLLKLSPKLPSLVAFLDYVLFDWQDVGKLTLFCILGHENLQVIWFISGHYTHQSGVMGTAVAGLGDHLATLQRGIVSQSHASSGSHSRTGFRFPDAQSATCLQLHLFLRLALFGIDVCLLIDYLTVWS